MSTKQRTRDRFPRMNDRRGRRRSRRFNREISKALALLDYLGIEPGWQRSMIATAIASEQRGMVESGDPDA